MCNSQAQQEIISRLIQENKLLRNKLLESAGNIRVVARVRPLSTEEIAQKEEKCVFVNTDENSVSLPAHTKEIFVFDKVFDDCATQGKVFTSVKRIESQ